MPRKNRLKKKKDFERVLKEGKCFFEEGLFLKIIENQLNFPRFGIVVGKKISKKAVLRNKLKRRLREILRKKLAQIKNVDGVLVAKKGLENKNFKDLEEILERLLFKAQIKKT